MSNVLDDLPEEVHDSSLTNHGVWRHKLHEASLPEFHGGIVVNFYDGVDDDDGSDEGLSSENEDDDCNSSYSDEEGGLSSSDAVSLNAHAVENDGDSTIPTGCPQKPHRRRGKNNRTIRKRRSWWRVCREYLGPGALVAVGYMDPGNWSTDIAGGSQFGYKLLFVVLFSSVMAMFLQYLSLKAGLATGRDLAQICRDSYPRPISLFLWFAMEIAIMATDVAEVLGSAVALKLLFGLPLVAGVCLTACDVLVFLALNGRHFRYLEAGVALLVLLITVSFAAQVAMSRPVAVDLLLGLLPSSQLATNKDMLFLGVGILGATVMPHNLFLHSSIVLTR